MDIHFSSPRPDFVESDAGFSVEVIVTDMWLADIRYTEQDRTVVLHSEIMATSEPLMTTDFGRIKQWDPPHEGEAFDEVEKSRIIENIKLAFQSQGWELQQFP